MSSPFPGMDPYLEDPDIWRGVHHLLIAFLDTTLNALLRPRYVASIGERLYVVQSERDIYPDILVRKRPRARTASSRGVAAAGSTAAAASDQPLLLTRDPVEVRERFIEIRLAGTRRRPVTIIEVLSPTNKIPGSPGREQYLNKQREILQSRTHLLEIDLLRRSAYTIAAPRFHLEQQADWDYVICLTRGGQNRHEVWPVTLRQRLPHILVPLAGDDPDIVLDLQEVLDRCYEEGAFEVDLAYRRDPVVPLTPEDAAWADALLRRQGIRPPRRTGRKKGNGG